MSYVLLTIASLLTLSIARISSVSGPWNHPAPRIRHLLLSRWAAEAVNHVEDFLGACADEDWDTALYVGQSMATAAGKAPSRPRQTSCTWAGSPSNCWRTSGLIEKGGVVIKQTAFSANWLGADAIALGLRQEVIND